MEIGGGEYIHSSRLHPHVFYRNGVHATDFGEQMLVVKILMAFWVPQPRGVASRESVTAL